MGRGGLALPPQQNLGGARCAQLKGAFGIWGHYGRGPSWGGGCLSTLVVWLRRPGSPRSQGAAWPHHPCDEGHSPLLASWFPGRMACVVLSFRL